VEGLIVLILTLGMFCAIAVYLFYGTDTKICPKCKGTMSKDSINGDQAWVCMVCGHFHCRKKKLKGNKNGPKQDSF
jgi:hypothetical protein